MRKPSSDHRADGSSQCLECEVTIQAYKPKPQVSSYQPSSQHMAYGSYALFD